MHPILARWLNLAGLLAVEGVGAPSVELTFAPGMPLRVHALGMLASVFLRADNRAVTGTYPYRLSG